MSKVLCLVLVFCFFLISAQAADKQKVSATPKNSSAEQQSSSSGKKCMLLGEVVETAPNAGPGSNDYKIPCCAPLVPKLDKSVCFPEGGGAQGPIVCTQCGNGTCDPKFENNCNCPADCK